MNHTAPAITVAYVMKGFFGSAGYLAQTLLAKRTLQDIIGDDDSSETECVEWLIRLADLTEEAWKELPEGSFGGMWEYEISEPFGQSIAEYALTYTDLPSEDWARAKIAELIQKSGSLKS